MVSCSGTCVWRTRSATWRAETMTMATVDVSRYDQDWHDGSIRRWDVELGRPVERLSALGLCDDTPIVFMSEHGEEFLEHDHMFHGQTGPSATTETK